MTRDPIDAFDADVVADVAAEYAVSTAHLEAVLRRHQESVRALPGVDDLVYEWRRAFPTVAVDRRANAYYLLVPDHVWPEFASSLGFDDETLGALSAVHARTYRRIVDAADGSESDPMVLTRE